MIRGQVSLESVIHSDGWRGYDGLVDVGYAKHLRVNQSENEFVNHRAHINGIESFWSFAKRRVIKFNGISAGTFFCTSRNPNTDSIIVAVTCIVNSSSSSENFPSRDPFASY